LFGVSHRPQALGYHTELGHRRSGTVIPVRRHGDDLRGTAANCPRGSPLLTERADLAGRAATVRLGTIPDDQRLPEDAFWERFNRAGSLILGALIDAVSAALRPIASVRLDRPPRMADFAKWSTAAERGLGWDDGAFLFAYQASAKRCRITFDADPTTDLLFPYWSASRSIEPKTHG
jgi:hypothetical protein